jgi:S-formylglutathione hydrolase FrmB
MAFGALYLILSAPEARLSAFTACASFSTVLAPSNTLLDSVTFLDAASARLLTIAAYLVAPVGEEY